MRRDGAANKTFQPHARARKVQNDPERERERERESGRGVRVCSSSSSTHGSITRRALPEAIFSPSPPLSPLSPFTFDLFFAFFLATLLLSSLVLTPLAAAFHGNESRCKSKSDDFFPASPTKRSLFLLVASSSHEGKQQRILSRSPPRRRGSCPGRSFYRTRSRRRDKLQKQRVSSRSEMGGRRLWGGRGNYAPDFSSFSIYLPLPAARRPTAPESKQRCGKQISAGRFSLGIDSEGRKREFSRKIGTPRRLELIRLISRYQRQRAARELARRGL